MCVYGAARPIHLTDAHIAVAHIVAISVPTTDHNIAPEQRHRER